VAEGYDHSLIRSLEPIYYDQGLFSRGPTAAAGKLVGARLKIAP